MNEKKNAVFLIGYISNAENNLEKVGSVKLAASSEEWDAIDAAHKKAMRDKEEGRYIELEVWCEMLGIKTRGEAVQKLMEKHFGEKFVLVHQVTHWPGRTIEAWKATTKNLREYYMSVERSDGQPF